MKQKYCKYYTAYVKPKDCWFVVGVLKSYEHMVFDRTLDSSKSLFEFFVPEQMEALFLEIIQVFITNGMVADLQKIPNRFK